MTNSEARALVHKALKDHGVEVYQVGTVTAHPAGWVVKNWDVQGVTRHEAMKIMQDALGACVIA